MMMSSPASMRAMRRHRRHADSRTKADNVRTCPPSGVIGQAVTETAPSGQAVTWMVTIALMVASGEIGGLGFLPITAKGSSPMRYGGGCRASSIGNHGWGFPRVLIKKWPPPPKLQHEPPELTAYRVDEHTRLRLAILRHSCGWCLDEIFHEFNCIAYPDSDDD